MKDGYGGIPGVIDYNEAPLGSQPGEGHLQVPYNATPDRVLVRVRNLSATQERRVVKEAVSIRRGGNQQLKNNARRAEFGDNVAPVELQFRVAQGENMDWEEDVISPVDYVLRHGGQRFRVFAVDPVSGLNAPWKPVPAGAWDLYMGNHDAMTSKDQKERTDEISRMRLRNLWRWVASYKNKYGELDNPYGFLEFEYEVIKVEAVAIDAREVASGQLIEV